MTTIKGVYENGQIKLLGPPPDKISHKVWVTFIEEDEDDEDLRTMTLDQFSAEFKHYLQDGREDLYGEYLKK